MSGVGPSVDGGMKLAQPNPFGFKLEDLYASEERAIQVAFGPGSVPPRTSFPLNERFFGLYQRQVEALFSSIRCLLCQGINPCFPIYFSHYVPAKPCLCPSVRVRLKSARHQQLLAAFRAFLTVCFPPAPDDPSSLDFKSTEIAPNVLSSTDASARTDESLDSFSRVVRSLKRRRDEKLETTPSSDEEESPLVLYLDPYSSICSQSPTLDLPPQTTIK